MPVLFGPVQVLQQQHPHPAGKVIVLKNWIIQSSMFYHQAVPFYRYLLYCASPLFSVLDISMYSWTWMQICF